METALATLFVGLIIVLVVFLVIRELVLWYFRLNQIADNIAYIASHYRAADKAAGRQQTDDAQYKPIPAGHHVPAGIHPQRRQITP